LKLSPNFQFLFRFPPLLILFGFLYFLFFPSYDFHSIPYLLTLTFLSSSSSIPVSFFVSFSKFLFHLTGSFPFFFFLFLFIISFQIPPLLIRFSSSFSYSILRFPILFLITHPFPTFLSSSSSIPSSTSFSVFLVLSILRFLSPFAFLFYFQFPFRFLPYLSFRLSYHCPLHFN